ncbi:MAG: methionine synthase [Nitrospirota bacterium]
MNCLATAIGSLPYKDAKKACEIILNNLPEVPIWTQLPQRSFKENMYAQYSENLPCVVCDEQNKRIFFDTDKDTEGQLERFYQQYLDKNVDYFKISEDYSAGFYAMLRHFRDLTPKFIKGHITGPISFGLTITDENKKAIIYHPQLFDAVVKGLAMKALWQISKFKELKLPAIIFIDEPYLSAFGSAYVNLSKQEVIMPLNEVIETIKEGNNVLVGIHCCGNTDWGMLMETKVDIINFDAYGFISNLALYPEELAMFLNRGGMLAWGIVPSSNEVVKENAETLLKRFEEGIELLASKGIEKELLLKKLFITPSCGTGSLSEDIAERVFRLTLEVTNQIKVVSNRI